MKKLSPLLVALVVETGCKADRRALLTMVRVTEAQEDRLDHPIGKRHVCRKFLSGDEEEESLWVVKTAYLEEYPGRPPLSRLEETHAHTVAVKENELTGDNEERKQETPASDGVLWTRVFTKKY